MVPRADEVERRGLGMKEIYHEGPSRLLGANRLHFYHNAECPVGHGS